MNDVNVNTIRFEDFFTKRKWTNLKPDGTEGKEKGLYVIVDGGYQKWNQLVCPFKHRQEGSVESNWSQHGVFVPRCT